jgi:hypothetical protein
VSRAIAESVMVAAESIMWLAESIILLALSTIAVESIAVPCVLFSAFGAHAATAITAAASTSFRICRSSSVSSALALSQDVTGQQVKAALQNVKLPPAAAITLQLRKSL